MESMELDRYILNSIIANGYMMLFGCTMPICWVILQLNQLIEMKTVIRDHTSHYRRIEPLIRKGLGFWEGITDLMMQVSCVVNQSLLCFVKNSSASNAPNNQADLIAEALKKIGFPEIQTDFISIMM